MEPSAVTQAVTLIQLVALAVLVVTVAGLWRELMSLADRVQYLEDQLHDATCHPADRVLPARQPDQPAGLGRHVTRAFVPVVLPSARREP